MCKKEKKTVTRIEPLTVDLVFDFMDNDLTIGAMIQYIYNKEFLDLLEYC